MSEGLMAFDLNRRSSFPLYPIGVDYSDGSGNLYRSLHVSTASVAGVAGATALWDASGGAKDSLITFDTSDVSASDWELEAAGIALGTSAAGDWIFVQTSGVYATAQISHGTGLLSAKAGQAIVPDITDGYAKAHSYTQAGATLPELRRAEKVFGYLLADAASSTAPVKLKLPR